MRRPEDNPYRRSFQDCDHPPDAIMWNPWNLVTQCHRCGTVIEALMAYNSRNGSRLTGEEMDAVGW